MNPRNLDGDAFFFWETGQGLADLLETDIAPRQDLSLNRRARERPPRRALDFRVRAESVGNNLPRQAEPIETRRTGWGPPLGKARAGATAALVKLPFGQILALILAGARQSHSEEFMWPGPPSRAGFIAPPHPAAPLAGPRRG
jgi:hypothetical protein